MATQFDLVPPERFLQEITANGVQATALKVLMAISGKDAQPMVSESLDLVWSRNRDFKKSLWMGYDSGMHSNKVTK